MFSVVFLRVEQSQGDAVRTSSVNFIVLHRFETFERRNEVLIVDTQRTSTRQIETVQWRSVWIGARRLETETVSIGTDRRRRTDHRRLFLVQMISQQISQLFYIVDRRRNTQTTFARRTNRRKIRCQNCSARQRKCSNWNSAKKTSNSNKILRSTLLGGIGFSATEFVCWSSLKSYCSIGKSAFQLFSEFDEFPSTKSLSVSIDSSFVLSNDRSVTMKTRFPFFDLFSSRLDSTKCSKLIDGRSKGNVFDGFSRFESVRLSCSSFFLVFKQDFRVLRCSMRLDSMKQHDKRLFTLAVAQRWRKFFFILYWRKARWIVVAARRQRKCPPYFRSRISICFSSRFFEIWKCSVGSISGVRVFIETKWDEQLKQTKSIRRKKSAFDTHEWLKLDFCSSESRENSWSRSSWTFSICCSSCFSCSCCFLMIWSFSSIKLLVPPGGGQSILCRR